MLPVHAEEAEERFLNIYDAERMGSQQDCTLKYVSMQLD